jgi:puromycin-sensitive aminopeptidase
MTTEQAPSSQYRLPRTAIPSRYELRVATDFRTDSFDGEVAIELELVTATSTITCNAAELTITDATIRPAGTPSATSPGASTSPAHALDIALDEEAQRVSFDAGSVLPPGRYVLSCSFRAGLNRRLRGYYLSVFTDADGEERSIASTQFESTDARRAFPCFDEPEMKAVFSVTLDVPDDLFAVSNAPELEVTDLGDRRRRVRFEDTIPMSTYLVAYCIGPFEATEPIMADGVPLRVVVPRGKLHLTSFALETGAHAVGWFHDYFDIAYPAQKLDLVAIPDFAQGAMENLGCVTFRETDLLCDPEQSSVPELSRIAEVIDHEIAHMWFGDLVTMKWWNGIWLNEAFATFMSLCCLDDFRPEWNRWVTFGTEKDVALAVDGLHSTRAIEFPVNAPDECEAMFDSLTYLKGGNVLRMVEQYLGTERFREGVRQYLKAHAYGNTETTDLWDAIEAVSGGEPVRALLDSWIFQGGHPLVTARREGSRVELSEEPFRFLPEGDRPDPSRPSAIGRDWLVPVRIESRPGPVTAAILGPAPHGTDPLSVEIAGGLPVVNAGGSGTYRLRYDGSLFDEILAGLAALEPLERFNLVSDSWASTLAALSGLGDFVALTRRLGGENDPNVWGVVSGAIGLLRFVADGVAEAELAAFVRNLLGPELQRIGYDVSPSDSPELQRSRSLFIGALGTIGGDEAVRDHARELFERSRRGSAVPASIAQSVLNVVVHSGGREEFDAVRDGYRRPTDPLSEQRQLTALASGRDPEMIEELLDMAGHEVRAQDAPYLLRRMMQTRWAGRRTWQYLVDHFDELAGRFASHAMPAILGGVSSLLGVDADGKVGAVEEVRRFTAGRSFGGHQLSIDQALERHVINARFVEANRGGLARVLETA